MKKISTFIVLVALSVGCFTSKAQTLSIDSAFGSQMYLGANFTASGLANPANVYIRWSFTPNMQISFIQPNPLLIDSGTTVGVDTLGVPAGNYYFTMFAVDTLTGDTVFASPSIPFAVTVTPVWVAPTISLVGPAIPGNNDGYQTISYSLGNKPSCTIHVQAVFGNTTYTGQSYNSWSSLVVTSNGTVNFHFTGLAYPLTISYRFYIDGLTTDSSAIGFFSTVPNNQQPWVSQNPDSVHKDTTFIEPFYLLLTYGSPTTPTLFFKEHNSVIWDSLVLNSIPVQGNPVVVSSNISNLLPNTVYDIKLSAINANGTFSSLVSSVKTDAIPVVFNFTADTGYAIGPYTAGIATTMVIPSGEIGTGYVVVTDSLDQNYSNAWSPVSIIPSQTQGISNVELQVGDVNRPMIDGHVYRASVAGATVSGTGIVPFLTTEIFFTFHFNVSGVSQIQKNKIILFHPNGENFISVQNSKNEQYNIFSVTGQNVQVGSVNSEKVDISNLNTGIYIIRIGDASLKFVK